MYILSLYPNFFGYRLGGYSHRKHWSCTRWQRIKLKKHNKAQIDYFRSTNKLRLHCRQNKDRLLPSGVMYELFKGTTRIFCTFQQSNMAATYDSWVASSRRNSNTMIETYREGKTPRSVLCGLAYAHGCALLVIIHVYDAKKILVDALGTLRTTGTRSL
jgi:hypothetical protein